MRRVWMSGERGLVAVGGMILVVVAGHLAAGVVPVEVAAVLAGLALVSWAVGGGQAMRWVGHPGWDDPDEVLAVAPMAAAAAGVAAGVAVVVGWWVAVHGAWHVLGAALHARLGPGVWWALRAVALLFIGWTRVHAEAPLGLSVSPAQDDDVPGDGAAESADSRGPPPDDDDADLADLAAAMAGARSRDSDRYADPLSVPALAWSLQHGDHAGRWVWHAGALYRYQGGVYIRDGAEWAALRLRGILLDAADRMAQDAADRAALAGPGWDQTCAAIDLLTRTLPAAQTARLRHAAEIDGLWPTPAAVRQSVEARYAKPQLIDPVLLALAADVRRATGDARVDGDIDTLNFSNGLLDVPTMTLRPHDPDHLSTIQLPVAYDYDADCPRFGEFLREVLPPDAVPVVTEMLGYLLTADVRHQKAFLLLGGGSNGKSVLLDVIRALLGADNCSATPLQALGEERFAAATLVGKLANLCADLPAATQKDTSKFKEVVAGDRIDAEEKFCTPFTFRPFARLVFSANEAPGTTDSSHGYWRRWLAIPFPTRYAAPDEHAALAAGARPMDKDLTETLVGELPGIVNLALVGLARLRAQGGFTRAPSCEAALQQYRERVDSVAAFLAEACDVRPGVTTGKPRLYAAYRDWCAGAGREPLGRNKFYERVEAIPAIHSARPTRDGAWEFEGVEIVGRATAQARERWG